MKTTDIYSISCFKVIVGHLFSPRHSFLVSEIDFDAFLIVLVVN